MTESATPSPKPTVPASTAMAYGRPQTGLSMVGVLTAIDLQSGVWRIRIEGEELTIGRGEPADGIGFQIQDEKVSRRHARIFRRAHQFVIEDLGSSNGTFVDGIPVQWTLLHDGDKIQIGRRSFYFDHLYEFQESSAAGDGTESPVHDIGVGVPKSSNAMSVRFWGTRGSIPTPGGETSKYGGNTTCIEIRYGETILVVDAGSGIRELSKSWSQEFTNQPIAISLLFTHVHWDHIQGFPFFGAGYQPGNTIDIYGAKRAEESTEELLSGQMRGAYFPIPLAAMQAELGFHESPPGFSIDQVQIRTFGLPHPGGCLGYRFDAGGSSFVFATDCELDSIALNRDELKKDHLAPRRYDEDLLRWMQDADLLVIDCQYDDEEYQGKVGWGHNSIATIVDLCEQVRPRMLGIIHHDPMSDDQTVSQRVNEISQRLEQRERKGIFVFGAREQLCLEVNNAKRLISVD